MQLSIRRFSEHLQAHDLRLVRRANRWCLAPGAGRVFAVASRLGDGVAWYVLMLALLLGGGPTGARAALQMALLGLASLLLYRSLKRCSRRPRPLAVARGLDLRVAPLDEFSFPSGHTLHAVGFTLVACAHFPVLGLLLWPFCALVAASRVVLGLHYPSDVLAAIVLGSGLAWLSFLPFS